MIQRIQTLFLFAAFILSVVLFFAPLYSNEIRSMESGTHDFQYSVCTSNIYFLILNPATGLLSVIIILLYKNRKQQIRLCNLNMLLTCIFIGTIFYFADYSSTE